MRRKRPPPDALQYSAVHFPARRSSSMILPSALYSRHADGDILEPKLQTHNGHASGALPDELAARAEAGILTADATRSSADPLVCSVPLVCAWPAIWLRP